MRDESESRILIYLNLNVCKWQKGICWVGEEGRWGVVGLKKGCRVMWTLGLIYFWIVFEE